LTVYIHKYNW